MMGKRNAHALAARQRRAGPHGGSHRPHSFEEGVVECPDCEGSGIDFDDDPDTHLDGSCDECGGTGEVYG